MFTGLIQQIGQIATITPVGAAAARLTISAPGMGSNLAIGESIAVDGACLTVESATNDSFIAYASDETLAKTTLGKVQSGKKVNLERALRMGDRLGGHMVAGHVDATGHLLSLEPRDEGYLLKVSAPSEILAVSVPKGSITVDGISLTLVDVTLEFFSVAVIPQTFRETNLHERHPGDSMNLESDMIGKYVARLMNAYRGTAPDAPRSMMDLLGLSGFVAEPHGGLDG